MISIIIQISLLKKNQVFTVVTKRGDIDMSVRKTLTVLLGSGLLLGATHLSAAGATATMLADTCTMHKAQLVWKEIYSVIQSFLFYFDKHLSFK